MKKPLSLDQFMEYYALSELKWAPGGRHAAFVVGRANALNGYDSWIYLYEAATGNIARLTATGKEKGILWQDEEHLLFSSVRSAQHQKRLDNGEELTVYYRIRIHGGEAEEAFSVPLRVKSLWALDEKRYVLSASFDGRRPDLTGLAEAQKQEALAQWRKECDCEVVDELPWWSNGAGFTGKKRPRLYLFDSSGGAVTPITGPLFQTVDFCISPDKRYVAYFGADFDHVFSKKTGLYLYELSTGRTRTLLEPEYEISQAGFLSDSVLALAASNKRSHGINTNPWFYTFDIAADALDVLAPYDRTVASTVAGDSRLSGSGITFKTFGNAVYFTSTLDYDCHLLKLSGDDGSITPVVDAPGTVDCFDVCETGVVFVGMLGQRLQELYALDECGATRRVSAFNESIYNEYDVAKPEHFSFDDPDGYRIDGWALFPRGFEKGKKYPAILQIHGGPKGAFGEIFFHEMQYFAGQGYFVIYCNPRGSNGKGNDFAEIRGAWGTVDYDNIMQFVDLCLKRYPEIDEKRLGVTGGSYGGYMTNWIIGHTDRFKAAVSARSIANCISFFGLSDIGHIFGADQLGATIESDPDKLWWHSPLRYAHKAVTPTLFLHSQDDYRCCVPEGYQMFSALKRHGVDTRLCMFYKETHDLSRLGKPSNRVRRLQEMARWFDDRLKQPVD